MSLLNQPTPDAQPAAQATPPAEPSVKPQEQAAEVKPLTMEDVERIATEKATRIAQSLVDKASYRLSQEAQQKIDALHLMSKDLGLSDEQVQQRMQKIVTDDLTTHPQTPQASEPTPDAEQTVSPVAAAIYEIFDDEGVSIDANDPEYATIMAVWNAPNGSMPKIRKATFKAIEDKRQRLQNIETTAAIRTPGGSGGGAPTTLADSAHGYWQNAYPKK